MVHGQQFGGEDAWTMEAAHAQVARALFGQDILRSDELLAAVNVVGRAG